ncbi:23027_t:CDS:2, partial [Gigaspora margarita]
MRKQKKKAIEMEYFRKDKDNKKKEDLLISKDIAGSNNINIESLANDFARLKICYVDQKKDSKSWIYKVESNLKELTKAVMDLIEQNKALNLRQNNQNNAKRNNQTVSPKIRELNIQLFKIKESILNKSKQYLMVKVEENNLLFNIRNLEKRRCYDDKNEMPTWANKSTYIETSDEPEPNKKGSTTYISISHLIQELNGLKSIA